MLEQLWLITSNQQRHVLLATFQISLFKKIEKRNPPLLANSKCIHCCHLGRIIQLWKCLFHLNVCAGKWSQCEGYIAPYNHKPTLILDKSRKPKITSNNSDNISENTSFSISSHGNCGVVQIREVCVWLGLCLVHQLLAKERKLSFVHLHNQQSNGCAVFNSTSVKHMVLCVVL